MEKWQEIFNALINAGIDTYPPGGHIGPCGAPYCVVQSCGGALSGAGRCTGSCSYRVYLVVPIDEPAALGVLYGRVRTAVQPLVDSGAVSVDKPLSAMMTDDSFSALISHIDYICFYSERN